jgi:putative hydrolase of the HAD superfamily
MEPRASDVRGSARPSRHNPAHGNRWALFDGDNTLWHIEALYDRARRDLVCLVERSGANVGEIEAFQRHEDKRLYEELGYSASRFAQSFENTLLRFVPNACPAEVRDIRNLALSVFEQPAEIDPDAAGVLMSLRNSHNLGLITAGERWVQERRVAKFRFADIFDVIRIVEKKTASVFRELVADLGIATEASWVVGDSVRSDILPALDAGLNAILIANHNWIEVEREGHRPTHLKVVDRLGEVLPIIVASGLGIAEPAHS